MLSPDEAPYGHVEAYLAQLLAPHDAALTETQASCAAAGLPPIEVSPLEGKLLYLLAKLGGARSILEVGTLGGYSTIWLARALPPGGRVVTIEVDPAHARVARSNIEAAGLDVGVELREGAALDVLPELAEEGRDPFDLVFLDADKPSNPAYLEWALRLTRPGSLIVADNVVRGGAVADPEADEPGVAGSRRFLEIAAADTRLEATAIQTVGSKGHDGFAVALVVS
ncbi:MAG TPA: O-methyltransferase [Actinomycetota bacterium]|nr:O-methyltransferase [Actinomycetota bacterium]